MGFDATTFAAAKGAAKAYTDSAIAALPKGIVYKGAVNYQSDLPNNAQVGDCYSVLYKGSSGTEAWNAEFVWGAVGETNQWIKLGEEIDPSAFKPMKSEWCGSNLTTAQAAAAILADTSVVDGAAFSGEVEWSDLSNIGLSNGEATARVGGSKTFVLFEMSSADTAPYYWQFNSFSSEWRRWSKVTANPPGTPGNTLSSIDIDGTSYSVGTQLPSTVNNRYLHTNATTGALEWSQINANQIFLADYNVTTFVQLTEAHNAGKIIIVKYPSEVTLSDMYGVMSPVNVGSQLVGFVFYNTFTVENLIGREDCICTSDTPNWEYSYSLVNLVVSTEYGDNNYERDLENFGVGALVYVYDSIANIRVPAIKWDESNDILTFEYTTKIGNDLTVITITENSAGTWTRNATTYTIPQFPATTINDRFLHTNASTGALEWAEAGGLPTYTDSDEGKVLKIVDGIPTWATR